MNILHKNLYKHPYNKGSITEKNLPSLPNFTDWIMVKSLQRLATKYNITFSYQKIYDNLLNIRESFTVQWESISSPNLESFGMRL